MHNATLDLQLGMRKMKRAYRDYYIENGYKKIF